MVDRYDKCRQAIVNLMMQAKNRTKEGDYEEFFEEDLGILSDFISDLENLPDEVNYRSVNDIYLLRAYIREELKRNALLKIMLETAIDEITSNVQFVCPIDSNCPSREYGEFRDCNACWFNHLKVEAEKQLPDKYRC